MSAPTEAELEAEAQEAVRRALADLTKARRYLCGKVKRRAQVHVGEAITAANETLLDWNQP